MIYRCAFIWLLALALYTGQATAKIVVPENIEEYLVDIEKHLLEKNYDKADSEFDKLGIRIKHKAIRGDVFKNIYKETVSGLKQLDHLELLIDKVNKNMASYKVVSGHGGSWGISLKTCHTHNCNDVTSMYTNVIPAILPFSSEFIAYVNERIQGTSSSSFELKVALERMAKNAKGEAHLARIEESKKRDMEAELMREEERQERMKKEREEQILIANEVSWLSRRAQISGYAGFSNMSVVDMVLKTQKEGGLEKYINQVAGCHNLNKSQCALWYRKLKAIQVFDDGVLYSFSERRWGEYVSFVIYADKKDGAIYQVGQSFPDELHVFRGMFSYTTVLGSKNTVPYFQTVNRLKNLPRCPPPLLECKKNRGASN